MAARRRSVNASSGVAAALAWDVPEPPTLQSVARDRETRARSDCAAAQPKPVLESRWTSEFADAYTYYVPAREPMNEEDARRMGGLVLHMPMEEASARGIDPGSIVLTGELKPSMKSSATMTEAQYTGMKSAIQEKKRAEARAKRIREEKKRQADLAANGRFLPSSAFPRVFHKPVFHTFGVGNTHPLSNHNYLSTFNVNPLLHPVTDKGVALLDAPQKLVYETAVMHAEVDPDKYNQQEVEPGAAPAADENVDEKGERPVLSAFDSEAHRKLMLEKAREKLQKEVAIGPRKLYGSRRAKLDIGTRKGSASPSPGGRPPLSRNLRVAAPPARPAELQSPSRFATGDGTPGGTTPGRRSEASGWSAGSPTPAVPPSRRSSAVTSTPGTRAPEREIGHALPSPGQASTATSAQGRMRRSSTAGFAPNAPASQSAGPRAPRSSLAAVTFAASTQWNARESGELAAAPTSARAQVQGSTDRKRAPEGHTITREGVRAQAPMPQGAAAMVEPPTDTRVMDERALRHKLSERARDSSGVRFHLTWLSDDDDNHLNRSQSTSTASFRAGTAAAPPRVPGTFASDVPVSASEAVAMPETVSVAMLPFRPPPPIERNPRMYKHLPPAWTSAIRPAGMRTGGYIEPEDMSYMPPPPAHARDHVAELLDTFA